MASARIIVNSRYCRIARAGEAADGKNILTKEAIAGLVEYVGTREGVLRNALPEDAADRPATARQHETAMGMIANAPELAESLEYRDYISCPNMANASALISAGAEMLLLQNGMTDVETVETLVRYVGTRPGADRQDGAHGLFGYRDNINLSEAAEELGSHTGRIWRHVISLRREDADRLGYNRQTAWRQLIHAHLAELAEHSKISPGNLRWYAGMHNEGHHPHVHLFVWSADGKEGYVQPKDLSALKSAFARDIFREDLQPVYAQKTEYRDALTQGARELLRIDALQNCVRDDANGGLSPEVAKKLTADLRTLKAALPERGRMVYQYMPPEVKGQVDRIAEELIHGSPALSELFENWQTAQREIDQTYEEEPQRRSLTEGNTFRAIQNAILQAAVHVDETLPVGSAAVKGQAGADLQQLAQTAEAGEVSMQYRYGKALIANGQADEAAIWLQIASSHGHIYASITLAEQYHAAGAEDMAQHYFYEAYSQILNTAADANAEIIIHAMNAEHPNRDILFLMDPDTPYVGRLEERLASMVERGIGTEPNRERAMVLYEIAAAHGSDRAVAQYERLYRQDPPETEGAAAAPQQPETPELHDMAAPAAAGNLALSIARLLAAPARQNAEQKQYRADRKQKHEEQKRKEALGYYED